MKDIHVLPHDFIYFTGLTQYPVASSQNPVTVASIRITKFTSDTVKTRMILFSYLGAWRERLVVIQELLKFGIWENVDWAPANIIKNMAVIKHIRQVKGQ